MSTLHLPRMCPKPPLLRRTHPNLYSIVLVLVTTHFALTLTSFLGPHVSPLWFYFGGRLALESLGVSHLVVGMVMVHGIRGNYAWLQAGLLASVTVFLLKLSLFVAAVGRSYLLPGVPDLSSEVPVFTFGLLMLTILAYRQPVRPLSD